MHRTSVTRSWRCPTSPCHVRFCRYWKWVGFATAERQVKSISQALNLTHYETISDCVMMEAPFDRCPEVRRSARHVAFKNKYRPLSTSLRNWPCYGFTCSSNRARPATEACGLTPTHVRYVINTTGDVQQQLQIERSGLGRVTFAVRGLLYCWMRTPAAVGEALLVSSASDTRIIFVEGLLSSLVCGHY